MKFSAAAAFAVAAPISIASAATIGARTGQSPIDLKRYEADRESVAGLSYLSRHRGFARFASSPPPPPTLPGAPPFVWPPPSTPIDPNAPKSQVPRIKVGEGKVIMNTIRKTIRYGPYKLPSKNEKNWQANVFKVSGMTDTYEWDAEKPCTTCVILYSNAELQYADGTAASTKTGAWLHHLGIINTGADLVDPMCGRPGSEMLFEQGNDKVDLSPVDPEKIKIGTHIKPHHKFLLSNELVNMKEEPQYVWVAISYEYLEGERPDFRAAKYLLLSVGQYSCTGGKNTWGKSNLTTWGVPSPDNRIFTEHSIPWTSGLDGTIIQTGGHLHDGGVNVKIYHNDEVMCDSVAKYAKSVATEVSAEEEMEEMEHGSYDAQAEHLAGMNGCWVERPIKKGDTIRLEAAYNMDKHKPMKNNEGNLDEVMGMAGVIIAA